MFKKNKFKLMLLVLLTTMLVIPMKAFAFDSSIAEIFEIRSIDQYSGSKRIALGGGNGYYLGSTNQFLPYKVYGYDSNSDTYKGILYCTKFAAKSPAQNSYTKENGGVVPEYCTIDADNTAWNRSTKIAVGVASIIDYTKQFTNDGTFSGTQIKNLNHYYDAEIAINWFLNQNLVDPCYIDSTQCSGSVLGAENKINNDKSNFVSGATSYNEELILLADAIYHKYSFISDESKKISVSNTNDKLSYNETDSVYSSAIFKVNNIEKYNENVINNSVNAELDKIKPGTTISSLSNTMNYYVSTVVAGAIEDVVVKDSKGNIYKNYGYLTKDNSGNYQVHVCNNHTTKECKSITDYKDLPAGEYTITAEIGGKLTYKVAQNYTCGNSSQGFQSVTPGNTEEKTSKDTKTLTFKLTVEDAQVSDELGKIKVKKKDADTNKNLTGATICINGNEEATSSVSDRCLEISENASYIQFINLPLGGYDVYEKEAPEGYIKDDDVHKVTLTSSETEEVVILNKKITTSVTIRKIDSDTNEVIPGAILTILDAEGNKIYEFGEDNKGTFVYEDLPEGKYYIVETKAPKGYSINKAKVEFEITSTNRNVSIDFKNIPEVKVPDTLSNASKMFIVCGIIGIIAGIYLVYNNAKKQESV